MTQELFDYLTFIHNNFSILITYIALLLAFFGYRKSVKDKYDSWYLLLKSFHSDLEAQQSWLSSQYYSNHPDKNFYSPYKTVYKLSFESSKEISRLGISIFDKFNDNSKKTDLMDEDVIKNKLMKIELNLLIAIFNERVDAFNAFLDYFRNVFASNSLLAHQLEIKLVQFGKNENEIDFDGFVSRINQLKKAKSDEEKKMYILSKQFYTLNNMLHVNLIGNKDNNPYGLYNLYSVLNTKINDILKIYDRKIPWFLKRRYLILILIIYFIIGFIIILPSFDSNSFKIIKQFQIIILK